MNIYKAVWYKHLVFSIYIYMRVGAWTRARTALPTFFASFHKGN